MIVTQRKDITENDNEKILSMTSNSVRTFASLLGKAYANMRELNTVEAQQCVLKQGVIYEKNLLSYMLLPKWKQSDSVTQVANECRCSKQPRGPQYN
ncbi:hypothetical protein SUGI_0130030 [Cryptomeria japonica]|nr:hypothetical protein SUGI_0130030 [Cryptomeria japonica]